MSNFWARTITGLSMVFILLAALWSGGWFFALVFLVVTFFGLREFYQLVQPIAKAQSNVGLTIGMLLYVSMTLFFFPDYQEAGIFPMVPTLALISVSTIFIPFLVEIFRKKPDPLINIAVTIFGVFYVALPFGLLNAFSMRDTVHFLGIPVILTGYFMLTWIYDTAAYLYGKQFGSHKFFERISPKKTWEGTIAGIIAAFLAALAIAFLPTGIARIDWLVLAFLVVVFGTLGDLAESLLKRSLNIKDSGTILPGHGGILDRFDTILFSSPFVFLYFYFFT